MATNTGSTGAREGRTEQNRTPARRETGISREQQNTSVLDSQASPAAGSDTRSAAGTERHASGTGRSDGGNGGGLAEFVRQAASNRLTQQKDRAARGLGNVARAVRQTTDQLRGEGQDRVAGYVEQAADGIDRFTQTLESRDLQDVVANIQRFARRQPVLFVGTALGLGFIGARFLKSSGRERDPADRGSEYGGYSQSSDWRSVTAPSAPRSSGTTFNPPVTDSGL